MSDQIELFAQDPESLRLLQQERLILEITNLISDTMEESGFRRADLAKALGRTRGRISQLLDGSENLTLRTIADVFTAMGKMICVKARDISFVESPWSQLLVQESKYKVSRSKNAWVLGKTITLINEPIHIAA